MDRHITSNQLKDVFDRRSFVIGAVQGGIGLLLAARMGYIAVAENEKYTLESESNRVNLSLIPPRRGWILDRNGSPLASNRADFRVDIIPERVHDAQKTVDLLSELLDFTAIEKADLLHRVEEGRGFSAVPVASGLEFDKFAAVSVRLPELPGVIPQRGFSRYYPTGPSVGHLLGYVGAPSREEYETDPEPLLLTPGFKMGKDGLEQQFETTLRGVPGARRVEVTAGGRIVRDLDTREDVQGDPIRLTIDGPLQDYAARRLGLESGSVVVIDCLTGDILAMASMPSFDPNSFSDGIGRVEYSMLAENDRVPLRNKTLKGLYPPGSTVKPMVAMAFLEAGLSPDAAVGCSGGLRVGNRVFHCWKRGGHGHVDMAKGIYQSCDVYFYHFAQQLGMDVIAEMARRCGLGQEFPLPVVSQFYGTVPDPAWKMEKYGQPWQPYDTVNATIGQGYMLFNPLQLAIMSARLATGKVIMPRLVLDGTTPQFGSMNFHGDHVQVIQQAMSDVVNGPGTAGRARLPIDDVLLAGKTGTAQVVGLNLSNGKSGPWKYRDHGLFISFAPFNNPRYACAVVIEHGGGSGAAYPVARDVMTFLFDPQKALDALHGFEAEWGGTAQERLDRDYAAYASAAGVDLPPAPAPMTLARQVDAEARAAVAEPQQADTGAIRPREDATPVATTPPTFGTGVAAT
ncbi:penicillin-binding protein 2 [Aurantiacibacter luteus]|uniref:Penicillin-binding protein n=1 Tax=Aurantiacibacter luteus TaxID=1581420 RepID=A0A0G9MXY4_9SPHN|nr:penicillin-binding protein 2 [Aurantiacibacter luteus]KLE35580.1 penicillin-binding protein [Aurantiacibacter luteus]